MPTLGHLVAHPSFPPGQDEPGCGLVLVLREGKLQGYGMAEGWNDVQHLAFGHMPLIWEREEIESS